MFNDYNLNEASEKLLEYVVIKDSIKYLLAKAKILLNKKEYESVIEITDEVICKDKSNYNAWMLRGISYYYKKNLFDSEESFVKAVRFKPEKKENYNIKMLYKLGMTYVKRKTWADAKTVFTQILKIEPGFAFAWRYLGLSMMRLHEFESAEEALNEANLLDIENEQVWAYFTILCLLTGRKNQALECLSELTRMNCSDAENLEEIGNLFFEFEEYELTAEIYNKVLSINPSNTMLYLNLADLYYLKLKSRKAEAIELLKQSLKYAEDENERMKINAIIENFSKEIGGGDLHLSNVEDKLKDSSVVTDFNLNMEDEPFDI